MPDRPRSFELFDVEFVSNIRLELEDCINGLEHQLLRLEVVKPKKRHSGSSVSFIIRRMDGSVRSSVYSFSRGEGGHAYPNVGVGIVGTCDRLYTRMLRRKVITTVPFWLKPVVFTSTTPMCGRDFDSLALKTSVCA